MSRFRVELRALILIVIFLAFVLNAVAIRGHKWISYPGTFNEAVDLKTLGECHRLFPCMRVGGRLVNGATAAIQSVIAKLSFTDLPNSPLLLESRWGHQSVAGEDVWTKVIVPAGSVVISILPLLPVLAVAFLLYRRFWVRAAFIAAVMLALAGWAPLLVNLIYRVANLMFEWPNPYFVFGIAAGPYEYWSIGYMFALLIYLCLRRVPSALELIAIAGVGQLFMENLGLAAAVAFFLKALLDRESSTRSWPWRTAMARLGWSSVGAISVVGLLAYLVLGNSPGPVKTYDGQELPGVLQLISWHWDQYGKVNFAKWPFIVANLLTLFFYPALFGGALGWFAAATRNVVLQRTHHEWHAAISVAGGFGFTLFVGMFISGLMSDVGRQALPLACLMVPLAAKTAELWWSRGNQMTSSA